MNGAPIPADPTGPPEGFLFVLFVIGLVVVFAWLFISAALEQRKQKMLDKQETLAQAIAEEKEQYEDLKLQTLINQSPGGRKPWQ